MYTFNDMKNLVISQMLLTFIFVFMVNVTNHNSLDQVDLIQHIAKFVESQTVEEEQEEEVEEAVVEVEEVQEVEELVVESSPTDKLTPEQYEEYQKLEVAITQVPKVYGTISEEDMETLLTAVVVESEKNNLKPMVVLSVIATESSFRKDVVNSSNATGLMQIIPRWHQDKIKGRDLTDIEVNVEVGTAFLAECMSKRKTYKRGLACYNGAVSPEKVEDYYTKVSNKTNLLTGIIRHQV